jgi:hypothetical protein
MKRAAPACVHVDGTARPQIIDRQTNALYYDILAAYYARSGIPTLINTSFNMHEEPIVCTPDDAIRAFLRAPLDYLAIGGFLCAYVKKSETQPEIGVVPSEELMGMQTPGFKELQADDPERELVYQDPPSGSAARGLCRKQTLNV